MMFCFNCLIEYMDGREYCTDCGGSLSPMSKAESEMRMKMKNPVKLITLEDTKEKELLKALLSEANITCYTVEREAPGGRTEHPTEDIYVKENRLEDALLIVDGFQCDLNQIRRFLEVKAHMIKPVLLITLEAGEGVDAWDLVFCLEKRKIQSCFETERYYEASLITVTNSSMCGGWVYKAHVYVDKVHLDEAIKATEEFFEEEKLQKEREKMTERVDGEDGDDELGEDYEYLPDKFFNWLRKGFGGATHHS